MTSNSLTKPIRPLGGPRKASSFQLPPATTNINPQSLLQNIDRRLDQTYSGMANEEIKAILPNNVFPNNVLYEYIRYIYDHYSIIDPLVKYDGGRGEYNRGDGEGLGNVQRESYSLQSQGGRNGPAIQKHQSFTFRQQSSSSNLLSSGLNQNTSTFRETAPKNMVQTVPDNANNTQYRSRNSLPLDYLHERGGPQPIPSLHPHPSYQNMTINQNRNLPRDQQPNNSVSVFKNEINQEVELNKRWDNERVSEETNIPSRPKMLTLSSSNRKKAEANQYPNRIPETPLKESLHQKEILYTSSNRREFDNMPTVYSRNERRSEERTHENFSMSEKNPTKEHEERVYEGHLRRLDDRAGVSKSISFNELNSNRVPNPEYENSEQRNNPGSYMRQQNLYHRPTNSVFLNEPYPINQAEYARSQAIGSQYETPSRNIERQKEEEATTIAKNINRHQQSYNNSSNMKNQSNYQTSLNPNSPSLSNLEQIPSIYRYCFVCQHPILQYNISVHEQKCPGFKNLYSKTFQEITELIIQKIHKFEDEINNILEDDEADRLKNLRSSVQTWMASVKSTGERGLNSLQMERNYSEIRKCFHSRELKLLEITHKLKWFLSIRQHIKESFNI